MKRVCTIGVSGAGPHTKSVRAMMRQITDEGAEAVFLYHRTARLPVKINSDISRIDALVLMGNSSDIDPKAYIHRYAPSDAKRRIHPATRSEMATPKGQSRARYEEAMLTKAIGHRLPVMGICGGMQRINVTCGGTLHQHLPDLVGGDKHMQSKQGIALHVPVVPVIIKENTMLAEIASGIKMPFALEHSADCPKVIMENSLHHQAIDRIGPGLRVAAVTDSVRLKDGQAGYLAEAIEADPEGPYAGQFILGVQWHPEFGASSLGQHLVRYLIRAGGAFARARPQAWRAMPDIQLGKWPGRP